MASVGAASATTTRLLAASAAYQAARLAPPPRTRGATAYRFFNAAEVPCIEAACERLIPAGASGPGALDAGVPFYLDEQLAGPWGTGEQLYRIGTWQPGTPALRRHPPARGRPVAFTPARMFRTAVAAIRHDHDRRGARFEELPAAAQDSYLRMLEADAADLDGMPSATFFQALLAMTVEGFFGSAHHGGLRDRLPWRLDGFPGAHAALLASGDGSWRENSGGDYPTPALHRP